MSRGEILTVDHGARLVPSSRSRNRRQTSGRTQALSKIPHHGEIILVVPTVWSVDKARIRMRHALVFCSLLAVAGCGAQSPSAPTELTAAQLLNAPTSVALSGKTLTLKGRVWRDFSPIIVSPASPTSRSLTVVVDIKADDNNTITPEAATADMLAVVFGQDVWSTTTIEIRLPSAGWNDYEVVTRDRPLWEPGKLVDVVPRLRTAARTSILLRLPGQVIAAVF
jgi:hypothetical protein